MKIDLAKKKILYGFYTPEAQRLLEAIFRCTASFIPMQCGDALSDFVEMNFSEDEATDLEAAYCDIPNTRIIAHCIAGEGAPSALYTGREPDGEVGSEMRFTLLSLKKLDWPETGDDPEFTKLAVETWVKAWMWNWLARYGHVYGQLSVADMDGADAVAKHILGVEKAPEDLIGWPLDPFRMTAAEQMQKQIDELAAKLALGKEDWKAGHEKIRELKEARNALMKGD